ncbi:MAG: DUF4912 domain-containing protein [Elusimicrobia bacterium]|jgi:hypothetical protein|nr:DUF4912 domain-containing protein [Elusimicrobiota bacterium]
MTSHINASSSGSALRPSAPVTAGLLPKEYGVTRLAILPRDPRWIHAYWEVAPYTWEEARKQFGNLLNQGRSVLRVHSAHEGKEDFVDVDVRIDERNWYLSLSQTEGECYAQLGMILPDGRFVLLAHSNRIRLSSGQVSDLLDERWGILKGEWDRLFELSGGGRLGAGSLDLAKMMAQRWELLRSVSSVSFLPSSPGGASWGRRPVQHKEKGFWLVADTEVTVYGATEPDATLLFQGQPVPLNPDGTFSFHFTLPDGEQVYPIHATNRDGDLSRFIEFKVSRQSSKSAD